MTEAEDIGDFLEGEAGHELEDDDFAVAVLEFREGGFDVLAEFLAVGGVFGVGDEDVGVFFVGSTAFAAAGEF